MNLADRSKLRDLVGLRGTYPNFCPDEDNSDCAIVEEYLLSRGYSIRIHKLTTGPYWCTIENGADAISVEAPSRKEALALCALGLCQ